MIAKGFKSKLIKATAAFLAVNILSQALAPGVVYALTSGPTQPELTSFEPIGTTEMVDLFTGDFTYNIPLFELPGPNGGYPFNLAYHAGVGMEEEASWVGLGWNLNPGAINRQMRGLPDDFSGDELVTESDMKPNISIGAGLAKGEFEILGIPKEKLNASLGFEVTWNNYRGMGFNLNPSLALNMARLQGGLNFRLSSLDGIGASASANFDAAIYKKGPDTHFLNFNKSIGIDSRSGLTELSLGLNHTKAGKNDGKNYSKTLTKNPLSASLSLFNQGFSPNVGTARRSLYLSGQVKFGTGGGIFKNKEVKGSVSISTLLNPRLKRASYGYMYLDKSQDEGAMDFNREQDGIIYPETETLPVPQLTYDIYSVNGQGMSAMYRPFRSDIGSLSDPYVSSVVKSIPLGLDYTVDNAHVGVSTGNSMVVDVSGKLEKDNDLLNVYKFTSASANNPAYEPYYFKAHGEMTTSGLQAAEIGGNKPVLARFGSKGKVTTEMSYGNGQRFTAQNTTDKPRQSRNLAILPMENRYIKAARSTFVPGEYQVTYLDPNSPGQPQPLNRSAYKDHHLAGFTATNPDGLRYVYALPAYNKTQVECLFSIDASGVDRCQPTVNIQKKGSKPDYKKELTDQFYSKTTTPEYAHGFLLTSILGSDYVDSDNIPGPSQGDQGYWVKFTYEKKSSSYKWRAPYYGANYVRGHNATLTDDKGSYMYGEKELWYLRTAETKSHIAEFMLAPRRDAVGAQEELQNRPATQAAPDQGSYSWRLTRINLFTHEDYQQAKQPGSQVMPLKSVHFEYDYSLCQGVDNHNPLIQDGLVLDNSNNRGKLTLKKVWFEHQGSRKGRSNPYQFVYAVNKNYSLKNADRWGNYKVYNGNGSNPDPCEIFDFLYAEQDPARTDTYNESASAWNLSEIKLPSGAVINVHYETDDYAYVQSKTAMQMTRVSSFGNGPDGSQPQTFTIDDHGSLRVYFPLEKYQGWDPSKITTPEQQAKEVNKYLDLQTGQVYFKALMYLRKYNAQNFADENNRLKEFISGYAELKPEMENGSYTRGLYSADGSSNYTHGFFTLKPEKVKNGAGTAENNRHPFSLASWQHLRMVQPDLMNKNTFPRDVSQKRKALKAIARLPKMFSNVSQMLTGFYTYTSNHNWGRSMDANKVWVRLNSPDKIKYGGGCRVKKLTLTDNWTSPQQYGQVYDYSTRDEQGNVISSGVAAYEPMLGGDEIALRRAKTFKRRIPFAISYFLYSEYPVNEGYFPGAQVGYSKVTVKSLASEKLEKRDLPEGVASIASTGASVHEFYTAKDFPVLSSESHVLPYRANAPEVGIPFLGSVKSNKFRASQGYVIELNDMHGRPKQITYYAQDADGKIVYDNPKSWVKYTYKAEPRIDAFNQNVLGLVSQCQVLTEDRAGLAKTQQTTLGEQCEFFVDTRFALTESCELRGGANLDKLGNLIVPSLHGRVEYSRLEVGTVVTNKIIHRSGLLEKVEAFDGNAIVTTKNLVWDVQTGNVVLSTVTNNFNRDVYSYSMPAYMQYEGMGAAYKNLGIKFSARLYNDTPAKNLYRVRLGAAAGDAAAAVAVHLMEGDEFIVEKGMAKATLIKKESNGLVFHIRQATTALLTMPEAGFFLYRSGRRNLLSAQAGSISGLENPLEARKTGLPPVYTPFSLNK